MRTVPNMQMNSLNATGRLAAVRLPRVVHVVQCCPRRTLHVRCQASRAKTPRVRKAGPPRKGFGVGRAPKQQEPWEKDLLPVYRVYYKSSFKPSRFQGPIELKKLEDGSVGVVASENAAGAELLAVSQPIAFLEGSLGSPPSVEDLHVSLLEANLTPAVNKVLSYLPRRPLAAVAAAPAEVAVEPLAAADAAVAATDGSSSPQPPAQSPAAAEQQELPPSLAHLLPAFWEGVGTFAVNKLSSKQLMRTLQASCWSEEVQDPAASQVRHERPTGFIGVWPEFAFMRHSCIPNTSVVVVAKYMLLHATTEIAAGDEFTVNKLGGIVAAPLAARQAAHVELFARPCKCSRCQLEQQLPSEVAEQLQSVYDRAQNEWPSRLQSALEGAATADPEATAELLGDLQADLTSELLALDEAVLACTNDADDKQQVLCAVYAAYDLAWQMEELLQETPDPDKLANCVALLRLFARGSEGHVYSAMALDELYNSRTQALSEEASRMKRKTVARQRQLTAQIQQHLAAAQTAAFANAEAVTCRYGMLPEEGLISQLQQGLTMFYAGLSALSAAKGEGSDDVPEVTRNLVIDGIPVTVVDTVEGSAFPGDEQSEVGRSPGGAGERVEVQWLEAPQDSDQAVDDAAALEAAAESAIAAAVAELEAEGASKAELAASS